MIYVTHQEIDVDRNIAEVTEEISLVYLIVATSSKSAEQMAIEYGFSEWQREILDELLSKENVELWTGILGK